MTKNDMEQEIKRLQDIIAKKDTELERAYQKINDLLNNADKSFVESPCYKQYEQERENLKSINKSLEHKLELSKQREEKLRDKIEELQKSADKPKHNERNAGRKPGMVSFELFSGLYEAGKIMEEIMKETKISRATYFRYKKQYNDIQTKSLKN